MCNNLIFDFGWLLIDGFCDGFGLFGVFDLWGVLLWGIVMCFLLKDGNF